MSDTLRAAAQQALEAFDPKNGHPNHLTIFEVKALQSRACKALRAALAEPTAEKSSAVADTLPPLPERLRTYSADPELSDRYSDAMLVAADEIERLRECLQWLHKRHHGGLMRAKIDEALGANVAFSGVPAGHSSNHPAGGTSAGTQG